VQGTDIAAAITCATHSFSDNSTVGKALILITDAEDHEAGAVEAAKEAAKKDIHIFVLSVGTPEGGLIPLPGGGYKKDAQGNPVTTRLNEQVGKDIAAAGDGVYIQVGQSEQAQQMLLTEIGTMQKAEFEAELYSEYDEQFPAVALLLLILIILEVCIMEKKNPLLKHIKLFR
jgi:Ca-activated chloride channel family protein